MRHCQFGKQCVKDCLSNSGCFAQPPLPGCKAEDRSTLPCMSKKYCKQICTKPSGYNPNDRNNSVSVHNFYMDDRPACSRKSDDNDPVDDISDSVNDDIMDDSPSVNEGDTYDSRWDASQSMDDDDAYDDDGAYDSRWDVSQSMDDDDAYDDDAYDSRWDVSQSMNDDERYDPLPENNAYDRENDELNNDSQRNNNVSEYDDVDSQEYVREHNKVRKPYPPLKYSKKLEKIAQERLTTLLNTTCRVTSAFEEHIPKGRGINATAIKWTPPSSLNLNDGTCEWSHMINSWVAEEMRQNKLCEVSHRVQAISPDIKYVGCAMGQHNGCKGAVCIYDKQVPESRVIDISNGPNAPKTPKCNTVACAKVLPCKNTVQCV